MKIFNLGSDIHLVPLLAGNLSGTKELINHVCIWGVTDNKTISLLFLITLKSKCCGFVVNCYSSTKENDRIAFELQWSTPTCLLEKMG